MEMNATQTMNPNLADEEYATDVISQKHPVRCTFLYMYINKVYILFHLTEQKQVWHYM